MINFIKKFKKWIIGLLMAMLFSVAYAAVSNNGQELIFGISVNLEDINQRTHITKTFQHPTDSTKRITIQSSNLLHYHNGDGFKEIDCEPFPEGKEIKSQNADVPLVSVPKWAMPVLSEDKRTVRFYDKQNVSICIYRNPRVVSKGTNMHPIASSTILYDEVEFEIKNNKLYFKILNLVNSEYPVQAYDDTDTDSTANKDGFIWEFQKTTNYGNYGADGRMYIYSEPGPNNQGRPIMEWTMSSGVGTISDVKLFLKCYYVAGGGSSHTDVDVHELTQAFVELQATWNIYSTGNSWTTPGGDYDATIIDTETDQFVAGNWYSWVLMGAGGSGTPLTLDWEDTFDILLKLANEDIYSHYNIRGREYGTAEDRPYLEITFEAAPAPEEEIPNSSQIIGYNK